MVEAKFNLKLIPDFDGCTSMVDWIERVELTCCLCGVKQVELVIPLRLMGGTLDSGCLLCGTKEGGDCLEDYLNVYTCGYTHSWTRSSGETTIEGIHKH